MNRLPSVVRRAAARAAPRTARAARAGVLALAAVLAASACSAHRPPVFEPDRAVGADVLVVAPAVRLGAGVHEPEVTVVQDRLLTEVRRALSGKGVSISAGTDPDRFGALRQALLDAWARARTQGLGRLRPGMMLDLGDGARAARDSGTGAAVLAVLSRTGVGYDEANGVPRPPGEVLRLPDDRDDYVIPRAGSDAFTTGVDLDLLVVGTGDGHVVAHRRVAYPARTTAEVLDAIPVLVREASRNITP